MTAPSTACTAGTRRWARPTCRPTPSPSATSPRPGARPRRELLERHPDLDGIAVASDLMAAGALRVLDRERPARTDDVAGRGYDDWASPRHSTAVDHGAAADRRDGRTRTRLLLEQMDGRARRARCGDHPAGVVRRETA
jgi:DNA-binding LacI/PurR family transcriptional regulator